MLLAYPNYVYSSCIYVCVHLTLHWCISGDISDYTVYLPIITSTNVDKLTLNIIGHIAPSYNVSEVGPSGIEKSTDIYLLTKSNVPEATHFISRDVECRGCGTLKQIG